MLLCKLLLKFFQLDRYFGTKKLQEAAESLIFEKTEGWSDLANEYRKELKERFLILQP